MKFLLGVVFGILVSAVVMVMHTTDNLLIENGYKIYLKHKTFKCEEVNDHQR